VKKKTKKENMAEYWARYHARLGAMRTIECAAMRLCQVDYFDDLPNWTEVMPSGVTKPGRPATKPYWLQRIIWDCENAARLHAYEAAERWDDGSQAHCIFYSEGPLYDADYLEAYAEWFPKLLAEALATRESQPWD
jgi:hypothetical protein